MKAIVVCNIGTWGDCESIVATRLVLLDLVSIFNGDDYKDQALILS